MLVIETAVQSQSLMPVRRALIANWSDGVTYMFCVLAILFSHEMGHFLTARRLHVGRPSISESWTR